MRNGLDREPVLPGLGNEAWNVLPSGAWNRWFNVFGWMEQCIECGGVVCVHLLMYADSGEERVQSRMAAWCQDRCGLRLRDEEGNVTIDQTVATTSKGGGEGAMRMVRFIRVDPAMRAAGHSPHRTEKKNSTRHTQNETKLVEM